MWSSKVSQADPLVRLRMATLPEAVATSDQSRSRSAIWTAGRRRRSSGRRSEIDDQLGAQLGGYRDGGLELWVFDGQARRHGQVRQRLPLLFGDVEADEVHRVGLLLVGLIRRRY